MTIIISLTPPELGPDGSGAGRTRLLEVRSELVLLHSGTGPEHAQLGSRPWEPRRRRSADPAERRRARGKYRRQK